MSLVSTTTFEGGADGGDISAAGEIVAASNVKYQDVAAVHGSLGVELTTGSTGAIGWTVENSGQASFYWSGYGIGTTTSIFASLRSTSTTRIRFRMNATSGKYELTDGSNTLVDDSTADISATDPGRADIRWEYNSGAGEVTVTIRLFLGANIEGETPDETLVGTDMAIAGAINRFYIGSQSATWAMRADTVRIYDDVTTWPEAYAGSLPPPELVYAMSGGTRQSTATVVAKVTDTTLVKLRYSTDDEMASPTTTASASPDGEGYVRWDLTSLSNDTKYYYQLTDTVDSVETEFGDICSFRTRPPNPGTSTLKLAVGACVDTDTVGPIDAFPDLIAWDPHVLIHLGDAYYNGNASFTTPAQQRGKWEEQIAAVDEWRDVLQSVSFEYVNSDHETNPDNMDSLNGLNGAECYNEFFRQTIPSIPLVKTGTNPRSKHRSWVDSNIRFIMLDIRNMDRSLGTDSDSSSKTMLGADQLAWFLNELDQDELLKVVFSDVPWSRAATVSAFNYDKWWSYDYERTLIGDYIETNGINVDFFCGDAHRLGYDDGTNNAWGGFPATVSAGFSQGAGGTQSEDYWQQWWPAIGAGTPDISVYARVTYVWLDSNTLERTVSGWDAVADVERINAVDTWVRDTPAEVGHFIKSGGSAVSTTLYRRDGSGDAIEVTATTVAP